ncbi:MAG: hypothetical protein GX640_19570 [Fibrobacter sp.]|nr:hypothetical protein [Fibrobacter sp.]
MNFFSYLISIIIVTVTLNCKKSNHQLPKEHTENDSVAVSPEKPVEFTAPADSLISIEQLKAWFSCNKTLDSLTKSYSDSFKIATPQQRIKFQEEFITAQNILCKKGGLNGGYKEYKWILENMGNPKNKRLLDSSGIVSRSK